MYNYIHKVEKAFVILNVFVQYEKRRIYHLFLNTNYTLFWILFI